MYNGCKNKEEERSSTKLTFFVRKQKPEFSVIYQRNDRAMIELTHVVFKSRDRNEIFTIAKIIRGFL